MTIKERIFPLGLLSFLNLQGGRPGIFVAPWLLSVGWSEQSIGSALFIAGILKMCIQTPCGHLVDTSRHKRAWLTFANALTIGSCSFMFWDSQQNFESITTCLMLQAIGEACGYPALYSLTLGLVPIDAFQAQVSVNETMNHLGNTFYAVSAGVILWHSSAAVIASSAVGIGTGIGTDIEKTAVISAEAAMQDATADGSFFLVVMAMGCLSILLLLTVDAQEIDFDRARGGAGVKGRVGRELTLPEGGDDHILVPMVEPDDAAERDSTVAYVQEEPEPLTLQAVPAHVSLFYLTICLFHLSNAAMLPLLSQCEPSLTAAAIIVSQVAMVLSAAATAKYLPLLGTRTLLAICFACIPVRGAAIVALLSAPTIAGYRLLLLATQVLDGVAGGIFGVVAVMQAKHYAENVPSLRSRFSLLVGAVKTAESLGAAFSNLLGEAVAGHVSYRCAFGGLAATGLVPLVLCLGWLEHDDDDDGGCVDDRRDIGKEDVEGKELGVSV